MTQQDKEIRNVFEKQKDLARNLKKRILDPITIKDLNKVINSCNYRLRLLSLKEKRDIELKNI